MKALAYMIVKTLSVLAYLTPKLYSGVPVGSQECALNLTEYRMNYYFPGYGLNGLCCRLAASLGLGEPIELWSCITFPDFFVSASA